MRKVCTFALAKRENTPGGTLQKSSLTDFHNLFQREVQDSARLAFFRARQAKRHRQYLTFEYKDILQKGNNSTLDFGQVIRARQIIQNTNKKYIYNEEFDPGSG